MDVIRLYQDYSIPFVTEGHKHARPGWANTECPWCTGNPGYHLGFAMEENYYYCWRCGWHPVVPTVAKILRIREQEAWALVRLYGLMLAKRTEYYVKENRKPFTFPSGVLPLRKEHKVYLMERGFDPERLEQIWDLKSTGFISTLDGKNYKNRILIPFTWNYQVVSFDTRVALHKASHQQRYKACPSDREIISHKHILYGRQEEWRETGILVEGTTDVWRMGTCSFAVSGIQYTPQQVRLISHTFKRVAVMFDDDPQARIQATKIVAELKFRGVDAFQVGIIGDPGGLSQAEADYLTKQIMK